MKTEKMRFNPFCHLYEDFDGNICQHTFTCQKCGSHSAVKITVPFGDFSFWSGYFMCMTCGTSLCDGVEITYYSSCFSRKIISKSKQLLILF